MKTDRLIALLTLMVGATLFLGSCAQEMDDNSVNGSSDGKVTITATFPDEVDSKVAASDGEASLELSWEESDYITVVSGEKAEKYTLKSISGKKALFEGVPVEGATFDVILSRGADYMTRSYTDQTQSAVASTDHLEYDAVLKGVTSYNSVEFNSEWAKENGGELLQSGCVLVYFKMPEDAGKLKSVTLTAPSAIFYTTNSAEGEKTASLTLAMSDADMAADNVVRAHIMTSMQEASVPAETELTLTVVSNLGTWSKNFTPGEAVIKAGKRNVFTLNDKNWTVPIGNGSAETPYILRTAADVDGIRNKIVENEIKYFAMVNDIDMSAMTTWTAIVAAAPYTKGIDFNGNDRVISNFTCKKGSYRSFFGVLNGKCHNVTFDNASVDASNATTCAAIISAYGGNLGGIVADIQDVHISGTVIGYAAGSSYKGFGGAVGFALNTVLKCVSADVSVSAEGSRGIGGLVGVHQVKEAGCYLIIEDCWSSGSISGTQQIGGIVGATQKDGKTNKAREILISNCYSVASVKGNYGVGGISGNAAWCDTNAEVNPGTTKTCDIVKGCIAWNDKVEATATTTGKYSSGAVVGYTNIYNTLENCYYKSGLDFSCPVGSDFSITPVDQPNASASSPLTAGTNNDEGCIYKYTHAFPYHGKKAGASETLSLVAERIGWDKSVWDLSGNLPKLKR